jgi:hypothetical protein
VERRRRGLGGMSAGSAFPLRFWTGLARIERGLAFVLRFALYNFGVWHGHEAIE